MGRFLTPIEREIWTKFAALNGLQTTNTYYEVPLLQLKPGAKYTETHKLDWWERITALRSDVLWESDLCYQLAELEETLTMEAIGQALCYRELWNELNPGTPIKKAWVITAGDDPRLHAGLKAAALEHYLINTIP